MKVFITFTEDYEGETGFLNEKALKKISLALKEGRKYLKGCNEFKPAEIIGDDDTLKEVCIRKNSKGIYRKSFDVVAT